MLDFYQAEQRRGVSRNMRGRIYIFFPLSSTQRFSASRQLFLGASAPHVILKPARSVVSSPRYFDAGIRCHRLRFSWVVAKIVSAVSPLCLCPSIFRYVVSFSHRRRPNPEAGTPQPKRGQLVSPRRQCKAELSQPSTPYQCAAHDSKVRW